MSKNASAAYLDTMKSSQHRPPKSRSSYRTTRMNGLNKSGGLSFMGLDVNPNMEKIMKLNNAIDLDSKLKKNTNLFKKI